MSRKNEIDDFLKDFGKVIKDNLNFYFNEKTFYDRLICYDVPYDESFTDIYDNFDVWKDRYKDKNINVFWTDKQRRFLQFQNYKGNPSKTYKLYLSLPKDKLVNGVNLIFDYIDKNDIETYSKVADMVRSDEIVLRIADSNDMKKVINFINNNKFLTENARKTNPFLMRNGVVGFAYDGSESYNTVVSSLLDVYFKKIRDNNEYDLVSRDDFKKYVNTVYNNTFINMHNLNNFNKNINCSFKHYKTDEDKLLNFKQITEFFNYSIRGNFSLDDYSRFVEDCRNNRKNGDLKRIFNSKLNKDDKDLDQIFRLFFDACCVTCEKYDKRQLYAALVKGSRGNFNSFSNGNDGFFYRNKLKKAISGSEIKNLCKDFLEKREIIVSDTDDLFDAFSSYVDDFVNNTKKQRI